jgi:hypothetical protein
MANGRVADRSIARALLRAIVCALLAVTWLPSAVQAQWASWDQTAHIQKTSSDLAARVRSKGADTASAEIARCYRDHIKANTLTQPLERCVIEDAVHSWMTASVYASVSKETLTKMKLPAPDEITAAMSKRVVAVLSRFKIPQQNARDFMQLVRQQGLPAYGKVLQKK